MRRHRLFGLVVPVVLTALVATGCAGQGDPSVSSPDEVLDALLALRDGATARVTAALELDRDEVRDVLRQDPAALELFGEAVGAGDADVDVDALVAELEAAQAALADHAVVLATGADGSTRIAAEYRSTVWADLRVRVQDGTAPAPDGGVPVDLQLQVDWATAAEVLDQPDLLGDLDEAAARIAPFLGDVPALAPVQELVVAFLGGELVGVTGAFDPAVLGAFGLSAQELADAGGAGAVRGLDGLGVAPRQLAGTAFTFDGYRRDGAATVVDVTLELRAVGELVLDRLAEAPDALGLSFEDVQEARAALDDLPDRLADVATLRLDASGALEQVRVDLLDVAAQLAGGTASGDEDLATVRRVVGELDATGLFLLLDVQDVQRAESVLGDPGTTVTPEQLADAFGALVLGGLGGGLDPSALDLGAGGRVGGELFGEGLRPDQLTVGDCFDDDALFGYLEEGAAVTVPCAEPHDNEAFAVVAAEASSHEQLVRDQPDALACIDAFADHVGVAYADSELVVDVVRPTAARFEAGDRDSVCYLYGPMTGSAAGTGR